MFKEPQTPEELWERDAPQAVDIVEEESTQQVPLFFVEDDPATLSGYVDNVFFQPDAHLFNVMTARTAKDGYWLWYQEHKEGRYGVIVVDGHLDRHLKGAQTGLELCRMLRGQPGPKSIIFVSADDTFQLPAINNHAMLFLKKGEFSVDVLMGHIRNARRFVLELSQESTDLLTGFMSLRRFRRVLRAELDRTKRTPGGTVSAIYFDLDGLTAFNTMYGHDGGSELISHAGRCIRACARAYDTPVRVGGDELVILLPQTDELGAKVFAARLERELQDSFFEYEGQVFYAKACIGHATLHREEIGEDLVLAGRHLIDRADEAMYAIKRERYPEKYGDLPERSRADRLMG